MGRTERYGLFGAEPGFYKKFFGIYFALVLQNVITLSVNLADNIMLGAYSETSLAGVASVNQVQFVYQQLLLGLGDALVMLSSQYWGRGATGPMKKISSVAMRCGLGLAAVLFLIVSCFPVRVLHLFTTDAAITAEGVRYLGVIRFTYVFFAITQIMLATLRSVQVVRIAFMLSVQTLIVNCGINYILIYGRFGAPRLGVIGAAIGTLAARILETTVVIVFVLTKERSLRLKITDYLKTDRQMNRDYLKIAAPLVAAQSLWGLNTAMQTVILGHMKAAAIAANSVASTLFLLVKSIAVGAASTASIIIGQKIGEGDLQVVKKYAVVMQKLFLLLGISSGIILFFLRIPVLSLYDLSDETWRMANTFLIILSVVIVGMSYQMPTNAGIVRGGGSSMYVVKMDLISIWMIVIPLSLVMAFVVKASPVVVVCCLNADQIFKCVPAFIKVNYGHWIKKLTRDDAV